MRIAKLLPFACYAALSVFFTTRLFTIPNGTGWMDWDVHLFLHAAVLKNLIEYGQPPFWNPWYCGGNVLMQNPQVALLSPVYPLAAIVSIPLAMKLNIVLHYFIGLVGMHLLLTRVFGLRFLPAILFLASAFTLSGAPALHLAVGHANFLPVFYLPLFLYFFCRALESGEVKQAVISGAILALMVFNGGLHVVPLAAAVVGTLGLVSSIARRDWRPIATSAIVGLAGALFAAPKLVPMLFFVTSPQFFDARSTAGHPDLLTFEVLVRSLTDPYQNRGFALQGQIFGWYEYGNYVGLPFIAAAVASMLWIAARRRAANWWFGVSLAVTTLAILSLAVGELSAWAPASLLAHLPFFSSFRVPSRYIMPAVLCGVMTVAWTARALNIEALPRIARITLAVICLLATADIVQRNRVMLGGAFVQDPVVTRFHTLDGPRTLVTNATSSPSEWGSPMLRSVMKGEAFFRCYEVMQTARKADTTHPLIWADGDAKVFDTVFSPNRISFSVSVGQTPSRVRLNQNLAPGWTSDAAVVEADPETGQPSVVLNPGKAGSFSFRFSPPGLFLALGLWLGGIGAAAIGWRRGYSLHHRAKTTEPDRA